MKERKKERKKREQVFTLAELVFYYVLAAIDSMDGASFISGWVQAYHTHTHTHTHTHSLSLSLSLSLTLTHIHT